MQTQRWAKCSPPNSQYWPLLRLEPSLSKMKGSLCSDLALDWTPIWKNTFESISITVSVSVVLGKGLAYVLAQHLLQEADVVPVVDKGSTTVGFG